MPVMDIRPIKAELRQKYRSLRQAMTQEIKEQKDEAIAAQVRRLWQYQRNNVLLIYVSTPIEVDTFRIIRQAIEDGKRVAVPRCVPHLQDGGYHSVSGHGREIGCTDSYIDCNDRHLGSSRTEMPIVHRPCASSGAGSPLRPPEHSQ